jgi:hypothetical protein
MLIGWALNHNATDSQDLQKPQVSGISPLFSSFGNQVDIKSSIQKDLGQSYEILIRLCGWITRFSYDTGEVCSCQQTLLWQRYIRFLPSLILVIPIIARSPSKIYAVCHKLCSSLHLERHTRLFIISNSWYEVNPRVAILFARKTWYAAYCDSDMCFNFKGQ